MSPQAALDSPAFHFYAAFVLGILAAAGLVLAHLRWVRKRNVDHAWKSYRGWLIMVLAYTVRKLPFTVRTSTGILHQIDPSLEEASISLGVSPLQTFVRLVVPLMLGGIVAGMVLTWVTVASELSSTVVLYSGPWRSLTIVMFQALEGTGAGTAVAAASMLIGVSLIGEGLDQHIPKGYIYFAMAFSVFVEMINLRIRAKAEPVHLHQPYKE